MAMRPTAEQVNNGLQSSDFGGNDSYSYSEDPITKAPITQDITTLEYYDQNPRFQQNPRYVEIKQSIRQTLGPDNPLAVTRRPGDSNRMVFSGGNTRLMALKELYQELSQSDDLIDRKDAEKLRFTPAVFHPWKSESRTHLAHLIENDQRAELSLIDKSRGIKNQWSIWEAELDEKLSQAQFIRLLEEHGYTISQANVSRYVYVAETLIHLLPEALGANSIGPRDVDAIRSLKKTYENIWNKHNEGSGSFEPVYSEALIESDDQDFSLDKAKKQLELRLAALLDVDVISIRQDADISSQKKSGQTDNQADKEFDEAETEINQSETDIPVDTDSPSDLSTDQHPNLATKPNHKKQVSILRKSNYQLASEIAESSQFGNSIVNGIETGFGFTVDLPDNPISAEHQTWTWWMLLALSDQDTSEHLKHVDEDNMFRRIREGGRPEDIKVYINETSLTAHMLIGDCLKVQQFKNIMTLVSNCREIREIATKTGESIWLSE